MHILGSQEFFEDTKAVSTPSHFLQMARELFPVLTTRRFDFGMQIRVSRWESHSKAIAGRSTPSRRRKVRSPTRQPSKIRRNRWRSVRWFYGSCRGSNRLDSLMAPASSKISRHSSTGSVMVGSKPDHAMAMQISGPLPTNISRMSEVSSTVGSDRVHKLRFWT